MTKGSRVIAYLRVSTEDQGDSGAGLAAQRAAVEAAVGARGWVLVDVLEEVQSGAKLNRPKLGQALARLKDGEADALVTAKLDRLSRSVHDLSGLLQRSAREGWGLVALDAPVDTTSPMGEAFTNIAATFAQLERRLIGERTREALAQKRAQGVVLGRPRVLPAPVLARILRERAEGCTLQAIAEGLTADGVPTARGGSEWRVSSVAYACRQAPAVETPVPSAAP